jgi:hypothetical protein
MATFADEVAALAQEFPGEDRFLADPLNLAYLADSAGGSTSATTLGGVPLTVTAMY